MSKYYFDSELTRCGLDTWDFAVVSRKFRAFLVGETVQLEDQVCGIGDGLELIDINSSDEFFLNPEDGVTLVANEIRHLQSLIAFGNGLQKAQLGFPILICDSEIHKLIVEIVSFL